MAVRSSQLAAIAPQVNGKAPARASKIAAIVVQYNLPPAVHLSSFVSITAVSGNKGYLQLGPAINLDCWSPCTSYGTNAIVLNLGG